ncbi:LysE family translocator [Actinacidiphila yeochonensis]|uniref:LysE family translocator n=1 Tax=Actinacidiphila yeochonensis TaxID=89050 RepID=UPI00055C85C5|nr:LysE family translocator [Actinacidiphila yeochonensis]
MGWDRVLGFAAMSLVLVLIPGPSVLFVLGRALAHGRRTALGSVLGNAVGAYVLAAGVSVGLGEVVNRSAAVFTAVKLAGAAYLVLLGVRAWRGRWKLAATQTGERSDDGPAGAAPTAVTVPAGAALAAAGAGRRRGALRGDVRTLRQGFVVGVTNPKTCVFFAAVLPQFVDPEAGRVHEQMLLLGLVFTLIALVCDSLWAVTAAAARSWFARSPRRLAAVGGTGGLAMIGLGLAVAVTGRADS